MTEKTVKVVVVDFDQTLFNTELVTPTLKKGKVNATLIKKLVPQITLYDGWLEVAAYLRSNKIPLAIVSHNTKTTITEILKKFNFNVDYVYSRYGKHYKWPNNRIVPKHELLEQLLEEPALQGIEKEEVLYMGDQMTDITEATKFGASSGACFWGTQEAELLEAADYTFKFQRPTDLLNILQQP